jgi:transcription initiation factor IIE alpha subunit
MYLLIHAVQIIYWFIKIGKGHTGMNVEVDANYCCKDRMEAREVFDVDSKKCTALFSCRHCKTAFEISKSLTLNNRVNKRIDLLMRS